VTRHLLDTHSFLWFVLDDPKLSTPARSVIINPANDILISPATYWEMAIKVGRQKLDLRATFDEFMDRGIQGNCFEVLPIEVRHASALTTLPLHHKDPFDRLLIAQASVEQIPIVSSDVSLDAYGINRIW